MRLLLLFCFFISSSIFAELPCDKVLSIQGFSTELKSYKMDLSFCTFKKTDKNIVSHVDYLNKDTKTIYLSVKKYQVLKRSIKKLNKELTQRKIPEGEKCDHTAKVQLEGNISYNLCERSEDYFYIKKVQEIIREAYYSD